MILKKHAEIVLAEAVSTGGDFAELFFEDTRRNVVSLVDGKVDTATTARSQGVGIRVYKGLGSVYLYTNDTSLNGMKDCARKAADAIGAANEKKDITLTRSIVPNIHPIALLPGDVSGKKKAAIARTAYNAAKAYSPRIAQASCTVLDWDTEVTIANTEGLFVSDRRVYSRTSIAAVASDGTENQTGSENPGAMMGFELFSTRVDAEACARASAERAVKMLDAKPCPAGKMPVVIDGGFGGVIFHESCGHSLEATSVAFGNSEFCGKLNTQIASPIVTAIDDGTMPNEWGSINIDDEGTPSTRLVLIENGILKNYMVDRLNGRRMNMPVTGSARRQSYVYAPTSRMRNTFIAPGTDDEAEIISSCPDGLYAKRMGGGSVNPVTGEFNFAVSEGYLIRNGQIAEPVRGASLIGKGGEILMKIDRVGKHMWMGQGMCGSSSGSIPTNVGQPMIRVTDITVGGR